VLGLTAERREAVLEAAVRAGARGIIGKDAATDVLLKAIEKINAGELWLDREMIARVFTSLTVPRPVDALAQRHASLTGRERVVIDAVVAYSGCLNKTIAQRLCMSDHTLRIHARERSREQWDTPELLAMLADMLNPPEVTEDDSQARDASMSSERTTAEAEDLPVPGRPWPHHAE
jgi:FixJ family two-component response regulator